MTANCGSAGRGKLFAGFGKLRSSRRDSLTTQKNVSVLLAKQSKKSLEATLRN